MNAKKMNTKKTNGHHGENQLSSRPGQLSSRPAGEILYISGTRSLGNCSCVALISYILVAIPLVEMTIDTEDGSEY